MNPAGLTQSANRPWDDPARMVDVDTARARILGRLSPLDVIEVSLVDALGLVLAEPVIAVEPVPPFANSAMDGFAVRSVDTAGASAERPVTLTIAGIAAAGYAPQGRVEPGAAIRIMTGAPVPDGADAIVRFEETDEERRPDATERDTIGIHRIVRPGDNIRPAGEDVAAGELVLRAGCHLRPAEIGILAALGRTHLPVHRRPRVALLSTGDEVVDPGAPIGPGQIRNSNGPMIAALIRRSGGEPVPLGVARDSPAELTGKLELARHADLIITTGGVSTGDYDVVKDVLRMQGAIEMWQVRLRPGKPLAFGQIGPVPLLGLPGNPVAAAVAFEQFARPAIRKMLGHTKLDIPTVPARLLDRIENRGGRRAFVRVRVEPESTGAPGYTARVVGPQGAGVLTSLVRGNGLLVVPEDLLVAEPGTLLPVQMLDWDLG